MADTDEKPPAPAFVSQAEYARLRDVTRSVITKWKIKGLVVTNDAGLVDVEASDARLDARPAVYRGGATAARKHPGDIREHSGIARESVGYASPGLFPETADTQRQTLASQGVDPLGEGDITLAEATRLKEQYLAFQRRQEFERESGKLVAIEDVAAEVEAMFFIVRERLLTLPGKLADTLVGRDRGTIDEVLRAEIAEVLNELSLPAKYAGRPPGA